MLELSIPSPTVSQSRVRRIVARVSQALFALFLLALAGFLAWAYTPLAPQHTALAALTSDVDVQVTQADWITFIPLDEPPTTGLVFYPGGRVDPRAYAPLARSLASEGFLVAIARMPLNLAVFDPDQAADVIAANPQIACWIVGGHSLGGVMAADFAANHPDAIHSLALYASYPAGRLDLSQSTLQVLSIYGSLDGVADLQAIAASRAHLPGSARFVEISGGNHSGFGDYGLQPGDNPAAILSSEQLQAAVAQTAGLCQPLGERQ